MAKTTSPEREAEFTRIAEKKAAMWCQMLRIEAYLPVLYRQKMAAAERLEELTALIDDEEKTVREIRARFN